MINWKRFNEKLEKALAVFAVFLMFGWIIAENIQL